MKIEIWSDYACPYCYIGKKHLETAIQELDAKDITIEYKAFELDPTAPKLYKDNINTLIANKYGISVEQAKAANAGIINMAREAGLQYNFDDLKPSNTFDAHRLYYYADKQGKGKEYAEVVMRSYFTDSCNISEKGVLLNIIDEIGLNKTEADRILDSAEYAKNVRDSEEEAGAIGVNSVPFFVFNGTHSLSGAQPVDVFKKAINEYK